MSQILIVDDEASIAWSLREFLNDEGHDVLLASSAEEALRQVAQLNRLDVVMLDIRLPGMSGLNAMAPLREKIGAAVPVVVMTAFGSLETAVKAVEGGAFDYLVKPFDLDRAAGVVRRALDSRPATGSESQHEPSTESLIGSSPLIQEVFKRIALVASTNAPVLITGESGTGKELVARAIHHHGLRRDGPFLPVCLPALSPGVIEGELFGHVKGAFTGALGDRKGLLELAHGGTVFLDEVGDIPPSLQVKLLRAIEHKEVTPVGDARPRTADFRVVAATNRSLPALIASGEFREDFFFRLSVFPIPLPPLRERRDDIPSLAAHFLNGASPANSSRLTTEVLDELRKRPWPGNVRELRNAIEHAAILARGGPILPAHLPSLPDRTEANPSTNDLAPKIAQWVEQLDLAALNEGQGDNLGSITLHERFLELVETPLLRAVLRSTGQNRAAAAEKLGIHRATLRQKLRRYGID